MTDGHDEIIRQWLAQTLRGHQPTWPFAPDAGADAVLHVAIAEGVVALLHSRVLEFPQQVPTALWNSLDAAARGAAARHLYQRMQCREILARLAEAQVPVLVLKGSALAYWAYVAPHLRECADIDLLLPSGDAARHCVKLLESMDYAPLCSASAGDMVDFEIACTGGTMALRQEIDIHWHLSNAPLFAFRFGWNELWADTTPLPALAANAYGLAAVPAMLHACMHRAQHWALGGQDRLKWLYDLVVMGERFGTHDWRAVQEQAIERGLAGVCVDGLCAAMARFGPLVPGDTLDALTLAASNEPLRVERLRDWWYFQRMNWRAIPQMRMRWRWLGQRMFPNRAYLRQRHGEHGGLLGALWRRVLAGAGRLRR